jgi:hypothetical protein
MEAVHSSRTLVTTYTITRCHNPKDYEQHLQCHENIPVQYSHKLSAMVIVTYNIPPLLLLEQSSHAYKLLHFSCPHFPYPTFQCSVEPSGSQAVSKKSRNKLKIINRKFDCASQSAVECIGIKCWSVKQCVWCKSCGSKDNRVTS